MSQHPPFYGKTIIRENEQALIEKILEKYRKEPATEELKEKIWNELQIEKYKGVLTIPFKIILRKDSQNRFPPYVEVILDTKV